MFDDPEFFWKNFRLGTELQIAGTFIYNGIYAFENMDTFHYQEECFEVLYQVSVGIERLLKVVVILIDHDATRSQEDFEKDLITHSHLELVRRIKKKRKLDLGKRQNKFLTLLTEFYKSMRYDRYSLASVYHPGQDRERMVKFFSTELNVVIETGMILTTAVSEKMKKFLGKVIGGLTAPLYELLTKEAGRLGIYTYEIASRSKAYKIFMAKEFDFSKEKLMQREVALYLLKSMPAGGFKNFLGKVKPLGFGQLGIDQYFESMFDIHKDRQVMDEMEYIYEEEKIDRSRAEWVMAIGSGMRFEEDENFEEEE